VIGNKNEEEADTRSCLYFKEENVLEIDLKIRISPTSNDARTGKKYDVCGSKFIYAWLSLSLISCKSCLTDNM
jgi:hypothetical protein